MLMGAGSEMINKMKQNRAMRLKPKNSISISKKISGLSHSKFNATQLNKLSKEELEILKIKYKKERKKRRLKMFSAFLVSVFIMCIIVLAFMKYRS